MGDRSVTITLSPGQLAYLIRSVDRDIDDYEAEALCVPPDEYARAEVEVAECVRAILHTAEQEQVLPH